MRIFTGRRPLRAFAAATVAVAIGLGAASTASATSIVNAGFESGSLAGWSGGGAYATTSYGGYTAPSGSYFAVVYGGCSTNSIQQSFTAAAGETLRGWAFFKAEDYWPYNDSGSVQMTLTSGPYTLATLFSSSVGAVGSYGGTPWVPWSYTFASAGTYQLRIQSSNGGDCGLSSVVGIDMVENQAPVLTLPAGITAEATSASGAAVSYTATATDDSDPAPVVACSPASGSTFAIGTTTVDCTATDSEGKSSSGSFTVTVADTTAPALSVPANITSEATSAAGATVTYSSSATDAVDPTPVVNCTPASGGTFVIGTTTVSCTATDAAGNASSGSFTVTVTDTTAPAVSCVNGPNPSGKNQPNGNAGFRTIAATDTVGVVSLQIVDSAGTFVSSNLASGSNLKLTQADVAGEKPMAGVVVRHISTTGSPILRAVDGAGNVTTVSCG